MAPPPPPGHLSLTRGVQPPLYQDAVARRALRPALLRSVSVPSEPPAPPPAMDVTYAVVNKPRRGGGASGRGHAPLDKGPAPFERDHTPLVSDHAPFGRGHASLVRDHAPFERDYALLDRDHAPFKRDHAPSGTCSLPGSPVRRPSPSPAGSPRLTDGAYEVVTPPADPGSGPALGFNFRIGKPKGPRDPPAEWSQV